MTWKIYTTKSGEIAVATPFNPAIVAESKRRMGTFIDLNLGEGKTVKAWKMDASHREAMEKLCRDLFEATDLVERVITWTADGGWSYTSPTLDGYDLVWFGRDNHNIKRFDAGEPVKILEILANTLETGGSRNNPKLYGSIKLRVRCRAAAAAEGKDWNVEVD
jgi:hypothetical protein